MYIFIYTYERLHIKIITVLKLLVKNYGIMKNSFVNFRWEHKNRETLVHANRLGDPDANSYDYGYFWFTDIYPIAIG